MPVGMRMSVNDNLCGGKHCRPVHRLRAHLDRFTALVEETIITGLGRVLHGSCLNLKCSQFRGLDYNHPGNLGFQIHATLLAVGSSL